MMTGGWNSNDVFFALIPSPSSRLTGPFCQISLTLDAPRPTVAALAQLEGGRIVTHLPPLRRRLVPCGSRPGHAPSRGHAIVLDSVERCPLPLHGCATPDPLHGCSHQGAESWNTARRQHNPCLDERSNGETSNEECDVHLLVSMGEVAQLHRLRDSHGRRQQASAEQKGQADLHARRSLKTPYQVHGVDRQHGIRKRRVA